MFNMISIKITPIKLSNLGLLSSLIEGQSYTIISGQKSERDYLYIGAILVIFYTHKWCVYNSTNTALNYFSTRLCTYQTWFNLFAQWVLVAHGVPRCPVREEGRCLVINLIIIFLKSWGIRLTAREREQKIIHIHTIYNKYKRIILEQFRLTTYYIGTI